MTASAGKLYLIPAPLGDPGDIGSRALSLLRSVDCLAAEDTRITRRLLARHGIARRLVSYHEHNASRRKLELIERLEAGEDVGLISDAGTPLIADPGWGIAQLAIERGIDIVPIPGPCALVSALIASGLACHEFCFLGFVPRKPGARQRLWSRIRDWPMTTIVYVSPHILVKTLTEIGHSLPGRAVALHKEISKPHEKVWRSSPEEILAQLGSAPALAKGEFVLSIGGSGSAASD